MKSLKYILITALFYSTSINAQQPADHALKSVDSLLNAYRSNQFSLYLDLTYPGVVKYYGGTKNFLEFVERNKELEQQYVGNDKLHVVQIADDANEWQCVIQRTHETVIDGKQASIISYMVGQSLDNGNSWKFVDVALNSVANLSYIMPDIFNNLSIPSREVVYGKSVAASNL